jgi:serine/threonine protein kinase
VPSSSDKQAAAGTQFGPYRIESTLGAGGMGQVYRALDTRLHRFVALKIAHEAFDERFEREARAIAQLNHPHICTLYDVGPDYLVMEVVEGQTLAALLARGALPLDIVLRYGAQMADALAAAHAKGIVHRDLKPGNVMLTKSGVKVLDFGLAKTETDQTVTQTQGLLGTPAYMAPEQREGRAADARTDIYALGLVLREMGTGKKSEDLQGLPAQFVHVVRRCLETDPASDGRRPLMSRRSSNGRPRVCPPHRPRPVNLLHDWRGAWRLSVPSPRLQQGPSTSAANLLPRSRQRSSRSCSTRKSADTTWARCQCLLPPASSWRSAESVPMEERRCGVREIQSLEARRLSGTNGAFRIAWSPDGKWIAFFADGKLKK